MSDRHYPADAAVPVYHRICKHCGRAFKGRFQQRYGSNACRQAAYRARLSFPLVTLAGGRNGYLKGKKRTGTLRPVRKATSANSPSKRKGGAT